MAHTMLDLQERRAIGHMLHAKVPMNEIAALVGRHRSKLFREITRNRFEDDELPDLSDCNGTIARDYASDRLARRDTLIRLDDLARMPSIGWTSDQITNRIG